MDSCRRSLTHTATGITCTSAHGYRHPQPVTTPLKHRSPAAAAAAAAAAANTTITSYSRPRRRRRHHPTPSYPPSSYGLQNEVQLSIAESTCGAKTAGWAAGMGDYGHCLFGVDELSRVALER